MATRRIDDEQLLDGLSGLFRDAGYAGASLTDIAEATGLQKSSMYHRFPGGKQQMAAEVVTATGHRFAADVLRPLGGTGDATSRIRAVARNLSAFYEQGTRSCLLDTLSVGEGSDAASTQLAEALAGWTAAFAAFAREAGASGSEATARAQDAIAAIEGALVIARVSGDRAPFARTLKRLPTILLEGN